MPTSTNKNNSHKSKKRSKSLSKKHKNNKRKYSNKKNNMRGGSTRSTRVSSGGITNSRELQLYNNIVLKKLADSSADFNVLNDQEVMNFICTNFNVFYIENMRHNKDQITLDVKANQYSPFFINLLKLGSELFNLTNNGQFHHYIIKNKPPHITKKDYEEILEKRKIEIETILKKLNLEGYIPGSKREEYIRSEKIFNKMKYPHTTSIEFSDMSPSHNPPLAETGF